MKTTFLFWFALPVLFALSFASPLMACQDTDSSPKYDDWLGVDGDIQTYKVRLDVFLPDGQEANELQVRFENWGQPVRRKYTIDGNRITAWLSAYYDGTFGEIVVATQDGQYVRKVQIDGADIRNHCQNGMEVVLTTFRSLRLHVTDDQSQPLENAKVAGRDLHTDSDGNVVLPFPADDPPGIINVIGLLSQVGRVNLRANSQLVPSNIVEIKTVPPSSVSRQVIRVLKEDGEPLAQCPLGVQPRDRSVTLVPDNGFPIHTNDQGEVWVNWYPSLPGDLAFIQVHSPDYVTKKEERTPEVWTVRVESLKRETIEGTVSLPEGVQGGLGIKLTSFDRPGERIAVRTDEQGHFTAQVLPGARYCVFVVDSRWGSDFWDGVLVEEDGTKHSPQLQAIAGVPVQIVATVGETNAPLVDQELWLTRGHRFRTANGSGKSGPQWTVKTDERGIAEAFAAPGELEIGLYSPSYNDSRKITVRTGFENKVLFHRENVDLTPVIGKLITTSEVSLPNAQLTIAAADGKTRYSETGASDEQGQFELRGLGERFLVFARTKDQKYAGFQFLDREEAAAVELSLQQTRPFSGQLLGQDNQPLPDIEVRMEVWLDDPSASGPRGFIRESNVLILKTKSDQQGAFEFEHVPVLARLNVQASGDSLPDAERVYLGEYFLSESEDRPREIFRIGKQKNVVPISMSDRFDNLLKNCRLNSTQALIVLPGNSLAARDFCSKMLNVSENRNLYWYLATVCDPALLEQAETQRWLIEKNWSQPSDFEVSVIVLDANEQVLETLNLNVKEDDAASEFGALLTRHRAKAKDARELLESALAEARETNRRVWMITGHTRCSPCFRLARWMDANREILEKDYIIQEIDVVRDLHGRELELWLNQERISGVPFHAILDEERTILVDSFGPLGNIGTGQSYEGAKHMRKMLETTSTRLTPEEIDQLIQSIGSSN